MRSFLASVIASIMLVGLMVGCGIGKPKETTAYCKRCDVTLTLLDNEPTSFEFSGGKPAMMTRRALCREEGHIITPNKAESATSELPDDA